MVIEPLDREAAHAVLVVGQFIPNANATTYERAIPEEGSRVTATFDPNGLRLNITPSITNLEGHNGLRITAGVYFEVAAKYAEKTNGKVIQMSNVIQCAAENATGQNRLLAHYPHMPLSFENACLGFRAVIEGGHVHDDYDLPV